jgi:hypothetical protein
MEPVNRGRPACRRTMAAHFFEAPEAIRAAVLWHLRHFRHAALALSWLNDAPQSTLLRLLDKDRRALFAINGEFPALNVRDGKTAEVHRVLRRIQQAIAEIGYDNFLEDVTSKEFAGGEDSPLGSADAVLAGGSHSGHTGLVVALNRSPNPTVCCRRGGRQP